MANFNYVDRQIIERLFNMDTGYVLNFSNKTFRQFIYDVLGIDIESGYDRSGTSKANRLRTLFLSLSEKECGGLLLHLLNYLDKVIGVSSGSEKDYQSILELAKKMSGLISSSPPKPVDSVRPASSIHYEELLSDLLTVAQISNKQERGYAFERFLTRLFTEYHVDPRPSFRAVEIHEQIDGSFEMIGETYLVEAKYTEGELSYDQLISFQAKLESRAYARGLLITYTTPNKDALTHLSIGRTPRMVIMTVSEIYNLIDRKLDLGSIIQKKIRLLNEEIKPFVEIEKI